MSGYNIAVKRIPILKERIEYEKSSIGIIKKVMIKEIVEQTNLKI